ncbi:MAG: multicopper oxidase domain-containing protein, partial [Sedimentisphaerales bacterium]|nr:multicopper oxidase domain-containing protein [Sedimentisphaerales bacterium]
MKRLRRTKRGVIFLTVAVLLCMSWTVQAMIPAVQGTVTAAGKEFTLAAREGYIMTPDGGSYYMWGYANGAGSMQYPGPTLEANQGDTVIIHLTSELTVPVSMVFPGQLSVAAAGGAPGLLTQEAPANNGGVVTYTFTATHSGTYLYHSGTNPELQIEMGLLGAIIIRPAGFSMMDKRAYGHADSAYDYEYLFLLT